MRAWLERLPCEGGAILVDKQQRWTSFDVVAKLRRLLGVKKIGHAGTLDPIATGLLIVCIRRATKQVDAFQALDKEYRVEIKLGARTESDDAETPEYETTPIEHLEPQMIVAALDRFIGTFEQIPPAYSAVHGWRQAILSACAPGTRSSASTTHCDSACDRGCRDCSPAGLADGPLFKRYLHSCPGT